MSEPRAAVVGSGVMGAGIAHILAAGGSAVTLYDPDASALERAIAGIRSAAQALGRDLDALLSRVTTTTDLAAAASPAQIVIEAGPEIPQLKQELFRELERLTAPNTVLASNTSAIPIRTIGELVSSRRRVLGTHFWHPPHLVPLVEVVQAEETDIAHVEWTIDLLARRGMSPVHVRADVPGFVGNRLQHALKREAIALVDAGVCDAETVDTVVKQGFGSRLGVLGPLEQADLGGLQLTLQIHQVVMPALDNTPIPHPLLVEKVERGEVGAKVGRGFRSWKPGEAEALRAQVDRALLDQTRRRLATSNSRPAISRRHKAEHRVGLDGLLIFLTDADAGNGPRSLIDAQLCRASSMPAHLHRVAGELLLVVEGDLALALDDKALALASGDSVELPPGTPYEWRVTSDYARILIFADPERAAFYRALSRPAISDRAGHAAIDSRGISISDAAARAGVELLPSRQGA